MKMKMKKEKVVTPIYAKLLALKNYSYSNGVKFPELKFPKFMYTILL